MEGLRDALTANKDIGSSPCRCELLLRYGLPCKHVLRLAFKTGDPIPRSLIHPRYWLAGPVTHARDWQPRYLEQAPVDYMSRGALQISDSGQRLAELRDTFNVEEMSRFDARIERSQLRLISIGERHRAMQDLPLGNPDPAPKPSGRKKKLHGAGNRLETGPETAKRLQLTREKAQRRAAKEAAEAIEVAKATKAQAVRQGQALEQARQTDEQRAAEEQAAYDGTAGEFTEEEEEEEINKAGLELPGDTIGTVPDLPGRPGTPPQRKQTHTLVSRTPTKPATPPRPPPPRASTPIEKDPRELPASTAPARLAPEGRPRRERVQTERATIARRAGWLPKAQPRE